MCNEMTLFLGELCLSETKIDGTNITKTEWKPLLLIVPLRLGLTDINPIYISGVQVRFILTLNIIGTNCTVV